ncbi:unnamed protein product [Owenia fusiformis]|uniref:Uncharacterized protein n=1 Tax=Owenia fusiformis TaxID=6347 RepID=A0A8J1Y8T3_OWEFU|nr:unnamed protein product [Owenia fusiformis]
MGNEVSSSPIRKVKNQWINSNGAKSKQVMLYDTGFGEKREESYMDAALTGSFENEIYPYEQKSTLAKSVMGKFYFLDRPMIKNEHFDTYTNAVENPVFVLGEDTTIWARAMFGCAPMYYPIGEQTLLPTVDEAEKIKHIPNKNRALLGSVPKLFALYVKVNGKPYCPAKVSGDCVKHMQSHKETAGLAITSPINRSFLSWMPVNESDKSVFIDVPIVGNIDQVSKTPDTGKHGKSCAVVFIDLFKSLPPGQYKIELNLFYLYSHMEYTVLKLSEADNVDGYWEMDLYKNSELLHPHPHPRNLKCCEQPIATGIFTVCIPGGLADLWEEILDRKTPRELFMERDREQYREEAYKSVAEDDFVEYHELGTPTHIVLASPIRFHTYTMKKGLAQMNHMYESIEVVILWARGKKPEKNGKLLDQAMIVRGDTPIGHTDVWKLCPRPFVDTKEWELKSVKNKHIFEAIDDCRALPRRRRSTMKSMGSSSLNGSGSRLSDGYVEVRRVSRNLEDDLPQP